MGRKKKEEKKRKEHEGRNKKEGKRRERMKERRRVGRVWGGKEGIIGEEQEEKEERWR